MVPVRERLLFLFSSDLRTERERGVGGWSRRGEREQLRMGSVRIEIYSLCLCPVSGGER